MEVVFDRVAGLDVGKKSVTVCVRTRGERGRRRSQTRTLRTMTRSIGLLAEWLVEEGVQVAAMESTVTYSDAGVLRAGGAGGALAAPRRAHEGGAGAHDRSKDAEWIAQLIEQGPRRPSFVPPPPTRRLRNMTRYRTQPELSWSYGYSWALFVMVGLSDWLYRKFKKSGSL